MLVLNAVLVGVLVYAVLGVLFAILFVTRGVARVDPAARGAPLGFRVLIFPGVAAFWPWMLGRWRRAVAGGGA